MNGCSLVWMLLSLAVANGQGDADTNPDNEILCPFFKTLQPDTSSSVAFLRDTVTDGNVRVPLAKSLVFVAVAAQQGFFAALLGGVLDLQRLDEVPGVSHLDLYNSQFAGVSERVMAAADDEGFVSRTTWWKLKNGLRKCRGLARSTYSVEEKQYLSFSGGRGSGRKQGFGNGCVAVPPE